MRRQPAEFGLFLDDLFVLHDGDVVKPAISWQVLPALICRRLRPGGLAVLNLLPPPGGKWNPNLQRIVGLFKTAPITHFHEFEKRILVAGDDLPTARELSRRLRNALQLLGSRQAKRIYLRTIPPARQESRPILGLEIMWSPMRNRGALPLYSWRSLNVRP